MPKEQSKLNKRDREIVETLLETGAVNFEAIGSAIAKFGPSIVLNSDGEDNFCWTMRLFIRVFRLPGPFTRLEELSALRGEVAPEIQG
jgi:hypothetical protein